MLTISKICSFLVNRYSPPFNIMLRKSLTDFYLSPRLTLPLLMFRVLTNNPNYCLTKNEPASGCFWIVRLKTCVFKKMLTISKICSFLVNRYSPPFNIMLRKSLTDFYLSPRLTLPLLMFRVLTNNPNYCLTKNEPASGCFWIVRLKTCVFKKMLTISKICSFLVNRYSPPFNIMLRKSLTDFYLSPRLTLPLLMFRVLTNNPNYCLTKNEPASGCFWIVRLKTCVFKKMLTISKICSFLVNRYSPPFNIMLRKSLTDFYLSPRLTLPLLMFRVLTNNPNYSRSFDDFAFITNRFNRWPYFHH